VRNDQTQINSNLLSFLAFLLVFAGVLGCLPRLRAVVPWLPLWPFIQTEEGECLVPLNHAEYNTHPHFSKRPLWPHMALFNKVSRL
jgi:hypothetical protein